MNPDPLLDFRTRADLALAVPPGGIMVELGVARGDFARALIAKNPAASYIGIDRYGGDRGHDEAQFRAARSVIVPLGGELRRTTFSAGLVDFLDDEIDLVYVDGYAHTGQDAGRTLHDWFPKVAPGGIFAGHDYSPRWPLTVAAVNHFVRVHDLELHLIEEEPFPSWFVRRPL